MRARHGDTLIWGNLPIYRFKGNGVIFNSSRLIAMQMTVLSFRARRYQLKAITFLVLACLIMLSCLAQRIMVLHELRIQPDHARLTWRHDGIRRETPPPSPCQLSAHALLVAQPCFFDTVILKTSLLMLRLSTAINENHSLFALTVIPFTPPLRIHLKNCVFRE